MYKNRAKAVFNIVTTFSGFYLQHATSTNEKDHTVLLPDNHCV
jgi:hypothetical protein